jgi:cell division cycle 14
VDLDVLVPALNAMSAKALVRLNNKLYDRQRVLQHGLDHIELYFPDGSVPDIETIVKPFLELCEYHLAVERLGIEKSVSPLPKEKRGALAVHCKAGLGRTGSLICCWMMYKLGWTARECIAWCRIMRPGSVVGPQQNWLETVEPLVKSLKLGDLADEGDLSDNDGTDKLATETMGMKVPAQPRKRKQ